VLLTLATNCYAAVAYIPMFRTNDPPDFTLSFVGIRKLELPTLREIETITDFAPVFDESLPCFAVSRNGARLFVVRYGEIFVYDGRTRALLHRWPGSSFASCHPILHPTRPVLIFGGVNWFDYETGQLVETAQSLGFVSPSNIIRREIHLSASGRFLTVPEATDSFQPFATLSRVIDLQGLLPSRNVPAFEGRSVVAFDDSVIIRRPSSNENLHYYDIESDADLGRVTPPTGIALGGFAYPGPSDSALYLVLQQGRQLLARQNQRNAPLEIVFEFPTEPIYAQFEVSGPYLQIVTGAFGASGCGVFPIPCFAGGTRIDVYERSSTSAASIEFATEGSALEFGPMIAIDESVPQAVPTRSTWLMLTLALLLVMVLRYSTPFRNKLS
jgi:hypothetical protein